MTGEERAARGARSTRADRSAAFTALADRHLDASYRLAHAILGSRAEAEDATHDALVKAWRSWGGLRDEARFEAWFHRILINTCRSRLRRASQRPTRDLSEELALASDPIGQADDREQLRSGLARLSPDHRTVLALRYYLDLPVEAIAERLGIPAGTVGSRIHYALAELRLALGDSELEGTER